jgi:hypothetical protein
MNVTLEIVDMMALSLLHGLYEFVSGYLLCTAVMVRDVDI